MKHVVTPVLIVLLSLFPSISTAGPLLDSARRLAAEITPTIAVQPMGCSAATAAGQELAERREGSGGYLVGGIFIPVIMPLIGMASSPSPPAAFLQDVDDADLACFQDGYRDRGRAKKVRGGWIGTGIGIGLWVGLSVVIAATADDDYFYRF